MKRNIQTQFVLANISKPVNEIKNILQTRLGYTKYFLIIIINFLYNNIKIK